MQVIPAQFARQNGLTNRRCDIELRDEEGNSHTMKLRDSIRCYNKTRYSSKVIAKWPSFYKCYGLRTGDVIIFELINNGDKPVMKFYSKLHFH